MGKHTENYNDILKTLQKSTYPREQYQTFMTAPEWRNVEMANEYGAFLKDGKTITTFPYFGQTWDLWKVIFNSFRAAKRYDAPTKILASDYGFMDVFIGIFTTAELLPKGVLSLLVKPFFNGDNKTEMQNHIADYYLKYAADLQTVPFYDQDYANIKKDLALKYKQTKSKTWTDWFTWRVTSAELTARRFISKPFSYWFHQDTNTVPATTQAIVKYNTDELQDEVHAKEEFVKKIASLAATAQPKIINEIYTKHNLNRSYTSIYAQLEMPRYAAFQDTVKELGKQGVMLRKIAGQERVQVKCEVTAEKPEQLPPQISQLDKLPQLNLLYNYGNRINQNARMCLFDVPVKNLHNTVDTLDAQQNTKVKFIHNF